LEAACRLGGSTIVFVDNAVLMDQWKRAIEEHVVIGGQRASCGIIREDRFEIGPPFVVAMLQTVMRRALDDEVRNAFRVAIVDEAQSAPCDMIFGALQRFSSQYILGLTATPDRKDGLQKAIEWVIGPKIASMERKLEAEVYTVCVASCYKDSQFRRPDKTLDTNKAERRLMADRNFVNAVIAQAVHAVKSGRRVLYLVNHRGSVDLLVNEFRNLGYDAGSFMAGCSPDSEMKKNPVVGTYKMCAKGVDFLPPPTVLGIVGPITDVRQAIGRGLQPQADVRSVILDFVYRSDTLVRQARRRMRTYVSNRFAIMSDLHSQGL
jgi:superfamily II DNA or RNA helicase